MKKLAVVATLFYYSQCSWAIGFETQFVDLYRKVKHSVVEVYTFKTDPGKSRIRFKTSLLEGSGVGVGSAFFWEERTQLVSNAHVVKGAKFLYFRSTDSLWLEKVDLVGASEEFDLALLKVSSPNTTPANTVPLKFTNSKNIEPGEWVGIIGNPMGLGLSITPGMVAGSNRVLQDEKFDDFLQISASINPGNSGGPAISLSNLVLGIVSQKVVGFSVEGLSFAIPSHLAVVVLNELKRKGRFSRPWIGLSVLDFQDTPKGKFKSADHGILVDSVVESGPSQKAGIRTGMFITHIQGEPIQSRADLARKLLFFEKGSEIKVSILGTNKKKQIVSIVPTTEPQNSAQDIDFLRELNLGLLLEETVGGAEGNQLKIAEVSAESLADSSGFKAEDFITKVDNEEVTTKSSFVKALAQTLRFRSQAKITVLRKTKKVELQLATP